MTPSNLNQPNREDALLRIESLVLERGDYPLFDGLSLSFYAGELVRIAGPNGAGKTSLMRALVGLLEPRQGQFYWRGRLLDSAGQYMDEVLYLGHKAAVRSQFTAVENLNWYCQLQNLHQAVNAFPPIDDILHQLGLQGYENELCGRLSAGQKRRVALARLKLSQSSLWVLDEPFNALDQASVRLISAWIEGHVLQGGTVIYSTHQAVEFARTTSRDLDLDNLKTADI